MFLTKTYFYHILLFSLLLIAAVRMLGTNLSDIYLDATLGGNDTTLDKAISWDGNNSKALYLKAKQLEKQDVSKSLSFLQQALFNNPADTRPLSVYARVIANDLASRQLADRLMIAASDRMPANKVVRIRSAAYWLDKEDIGKAVNEWRYALSIDTSLRSQLFPVFLKMVESSQAENILKPLTDAPPDWWGTFIKYAVSSAVSTESLINLINMRHNSPVPLTQDERADMVERLMKDKSWDMAYLLWVEGLTSEQRKSLSGLYDGGFETHNYNNGFTWHFKPLKGIAIRTSYKRDGEGLKSLHVRFRGEETRFSHVYQYTLLPPGEYHFTAQERTERLEGRGRLRWMVHCADDSAQKIGHSELLLISEKWRNIDFDFKVPENGCKAQLVSLETVGKHVFDHKLIGSIWFDRLSIKRKD